MSRLITTVAAFAATTLMSSAAFAGCNSGTYCTSSGHTSTLPSLSSWSGSSWSGSNYSSASSYEATARHLFPALQAIAIHQAQAIRQIRCITHHILTAHQIATPEQCLHPMQMRLMAQAQSAMPMQVAMLRSSVFLDLHLAFRVSAQASRFKRHLALLAFITPAAEKFSAVTML